MQRKRLLGLQILRACAAWMVVMYHVNQSYFNWKPPSLFLKSFNAGDIGVDIFFVLSGFIMYNSVNYNKKGGWSFFVDRFFRIFPAYWLLTILLIISFIILPPRSYYTFYTWETLIKSFFLIPNQNPNGYGNYPFLYVGWTLTYEMFFYCVLSISLVINKKGALIISLVFLLLLPFLLVDDFLGHSNYMLYEFVVGILIAHVYRIIKSSNYSKQIIKPIYALPIALILLIFSVFTKKHFGFVLPVKLVIASNVIVLFLFLEDIIERIPGFRFMVSLGDFSYSTYLIHPIILGWLYLIFMSFELVLVQYLIIFFFLLLVYIFSKLSYRYIESNKWLIELKEKVRGKTIV